MKTTAKHFKLFQKECYKWQDILGLKDWEIFCTHEDGDGENLASVSCNPLSRLATITLYKDWGDLYEPTAYAVRGAAAHEVFHVLTCTLNSCAAARYVTTEEIIAADHYIVRVLDNVLFPKYP